MPLPFQFGNAVSVGSFTIENKTPQNIIINRKILARNDAILDTYEVYELTDSTFDIWFQKVYFKKALDKLV